MYCCSQLGTIVLGYNSFMLYCLKATSYCVEFTEDSY
jgi:hypothetical protein